MVVVIASIGDLESMGGRLCMMRTRVASQISARRILCRYITHPPHFWNIIRWGVPLTDLSHLGNLHQDENALLKFCWVLCDEKLDPLALLYLMQ